jgi:hypothetical protein
MRTKVLATIAFLAEQQKWDKVMMACATNGTMESRDDPSRRRATNLERSGDLYTQKNRPVTLPKTSNPKRVRWSLPHVLGPVTVTGSPRILRRLAVLPRRVDLTERSVCLKGKTNSLGIYASVSDAPSLFPIECFRQGPRPDSAGDFTISQEAKRNRAKANGSASAFTSKDQTDKQSEPRSFRHFIRSAAFTPSHLFPKFCHQSRARLYISSCMIRRR